LEVLTNFVNRSYPTPKVPNKTNRDPPNTGFDLLGATKCSVIGVVALPFGRLHLQGAPNCLGQTLDTERNGDGVACGTPASEGGCGADDCHLRYKRKFHHLRPPCAGAQSLSRLIPLLVAVAGFALKRSSLKLLFPLEAIRSSFVLLTHWEGCVVLSFLFFFSLEARSLVLNVFFFFFP
jgi:hypothetical protein